MKKLRLLQRLSEAKIHELQVQIQQWNQQIVQCQKDYARLETNLQSEMRLVEENPQLSMGLSQFIKRVQEQKHQLKATEQSLVVLMKEGQSKLQAHFQEMKTYEKAEQLYTFRSDLAKTDRSMNFRLRDVGRATSAAPTFFPPALIKDMGGNDHSFIDGGIGYNNPAELAFSMAQELYPGAPGYIVLSLGTGVKVRPGNGYETLRSSGKVGWVRPLIEILMDNSSKETDRALKRLLPPVLIQDVPTRQYYRTQVTLTKEQSSMDSVDPKIVEQWHAAGNPLKNAELKETLDEFIASAVRIYSRHLTKER